MKSSGVFVRYDLKDSVVSDPLSFRHLTNDPVLYPVMDAVINGDLQSLEKAVFNALQTKEPREVVYRGLLKGMKIVSNLWEEGVYYLPQTLNASDTMLRGIEMCEKAMGAKVKRRGVVITHTVEGDIHDLGQKLVNAFLRSSGFQVIDLGKDVPVNEVIAAVKDCKPLLLCGTALMTMTLNALERTARGLLEEGIKVPFACGGSGVNVNYVNSFPLGIYGREAHIPAHIASDCLSGLNWQQIAEKYNDTHGVLK